MRISVYKCVKKVPRLSAIANNASNWIRNWCWQSADPSRLNYSTCHNVIRASFVLRIRENDVKYGTVRGGEVTKNLFIQSQTDCMNKLLRFGQQPCIWQSVGHLARRTTAGRPPSHAKSARWAPLRRSRSSMCSTNNLIRTGKVWERASSRLLFAASVPREGSSHFISRRRKQRGLGSERACHEWFLTPACEVSDDSHMANSSREPVSSCPSSSARMHLRSLHQSQLPWSCSVMDSGDGLNHTKRCALFRTTVLDVHSQTWDWRVATSPFQSSRCLHKHEGRLLILVQCFALVCSQQSTHQNGAVP